MVLRRCPLSDLPPTTRVDASGPAASRVPNDPEDVIILNKRYMADQELVQAERFVSAIKNKYEIEFCGNQIMFA